MKTAMQRKPQPAGYPKLLVLKPEEMQPTLAEAFARWCETGEYPADSGLFLFVGGEMPYQNVLTGALADPGEDWETLTLVKVKGDKKNSWMILRIPA